MRKVFRMCEYGLRVGNWLGWARYTVRTAKIVMVCACLRTYIYIHMFNFPIMHRM